MTSHQTSVAEPIVKAPHTVNMPLMNEEECMEIKNRVNILLVSEEYNKIPPYFGQTLINTRQILEKCSNDS
jgi:3-phenylpropionate/cinnamic acid dioxygenase small subunit